MAGYGFDPTFNRPGQRQHLGLSGRTSLYRWKAGILRSPDLQANKAVKVTFPFGELTLPTQSGRSSNGKAAA